MGGRERDPDCECHSDNSNRSRKNPRIPAVSTHTIGAIYPPASAVACGVALDFGFVFCDIVLSIYYVLIKYDRNDARPAVMYTLKHTFLEAHLA